MGFADALIAVQNAALAAESLDLGICYMGTTLCSTGEQIEFFDLPVGVFPAPTLAAGMPAENPESRARLPVDSIVQEERYRDFDNERISETYRDQETEGWERYMEIPELADAIRRAGVDNLAQVYTRVKYTSDENVRISRNLLQDLCRQGFIDGTTPG